MVKFTVAYSNGTVDTVRCLIKDVGFNLAVSSSQCHPRSVISTVLRTEVVYSTCEWRQGERETYCTAL